MSARLAAAAFALAIWILFRLVRDLFRQPSPALWLPVAWLLIAGSRGLGAWFQLSGPSNYADQYLEGNPIDRYGLSVLIGLSVIVLSRRRDQVLLLLKKNWPVVLYFGYCLLSILWSDYPLVAGKRWFRGVGDLTMVLILLSEPSWLEAFKRVATRVAFILLPVSVLFIRYYPELGRAYGNDGTQYWTGVATGKNGLGNLCLVFGLAAAWNVLLAWEDRQNSNRPRHLIAYCTVLAMAIWLLWISDSKTSLSCFVIVMCMMATTAISPTLRKPLALNAVTALVVGVSFMVLFLGVGAGFLETLGRDSTLTGRTNIWAAALEFAENPILGAGYESFWLGTRLEAVSRTLGVGLNQAHNGYIEIFLNLGWLGIGLLALIIVVGYRGIVSGFRENVKGAQIRLAYFTIAIIYNFTEGMFKMMSPVWIFFLLSTMAGAVGWSAVTIAVPPARPKGARKWQATARIARPVH